MDLTRDFVNKIEEMAKPTTVDIYGLEYSKGLDKLSPVLLPDAETLKTRSLYSVVNYLKHCDERSVKHDVIIHVVDHETVEIRSLIKETGQRDTILRAKAPSPNLSLNQFIQRESFNIMLQSCFVEEHDRNLVLSSIGKMKYENSVKMEDDGVTQTVASSAGVALVREEQIPNPVKLSPFRTFTEIEQPASDFVLRVDENCRVGLFEADGGKWCNDAMLKIAAYLVENLSTIGEDGEIECFYTILS